MKYGSTSIGLIIYFLRKMCWMLDMKIIWRTVNVSLLGGRVR